jgi:uncharacterized membrane protein
MTALMPTEPTKDERTMAAVAHGLTFVEGGIIGPLILYLVKKDESEFVAFHALQSLYFGLIFLGVTLVTCGLGVILVVPYIIYEVLAVIKANDGEWWELPIAGPLALRKHHP